MTLFGGGADFDAADFAGDCLGEFFDEFYQAGVFVGRGCGFDVLLELFDECFVGAVFVFFCKYDCGFDELSADGVGNSGNGTFDYGGVGHQCVFHFARADAIAR